MNLRVAIKTVHGFMESYTGDHGEALRTLVAHTEAEAGARAGAEESEGPCRACVKLVGHVGRWWRCMECGESYSG